MVQQVMEGPAVTKKSNFIFSHSATSFLLCGSNILWSYHSSDSSDMLSRDHTILHMVHTHCQVMTLFLRWFTPTVKW